MLGPRAQDLELVRRHHANLLHEAHHRPIPIACLKPGSRHPPRGQPTAACRGVLRSPSSVIVALVVAMRRVKAPSVSSTEGSCEPGSRAPAARIHLFLETDSTSATLVADIQGSHPLGG